MSKFHITARQFQNQVLHWFDQHGRKHLPWQNSKTPYRVWVSEIMLQQTQVSTVISYFERFIQQFPNVHTLANAHEDQVLHLWTGLGYYSRARNLHRAAKMICEQFNGEFPDETSELEKLPGIGRSTAGAILSIAFQKEAAILDGNVKRVLTRFHAIPDWPGEKKTHDLLWKIAENYAPKQRTADYSQAMMDLGATLCTRGQPLCKQCPLVKNCIAHAKGLEKKLPQSKPKKILPIRHATLLFIQNKHHILLEKRPPSGIWGGLWTPPEMSTHAATREINQFCKTQLRILPGKVHRQEVFRHTFSHFHLDILPVIVHTSAKKAKIMDDNQQIWYNLRDTQAVGLPAPVKKLLRNIPHDSHD